MASAYTDVELDRLLVESAARIEDPPHPYLTQAVLARLDEAPTGRIAGSAIRLLRPARLVGAGVALAALVAGVLLITPSTRDAMADWFGLRGVSVSEEDRAAPDNHGARLGLGEPVDLATATEETDFEVLVPPEQFGPPDEVYVAASPPGGRISLLYGPSAELPPSEPTGVGMLLTEFRAEISGGIIEKRLPDGAGLRTVTVDGSPGLWISGAPHTLAYLDATGEPFVEKARLAGNTLLWQQGDVTLRLESALSLDDAIALASSLEVSDDAR